jgi:mono/diheme cytochrome c family protein
MRMLTPEKLRSWRRCLPAGLLASVVACIALLGCEVPADNQSTTPARQLYPVTAVRGISWLKYLGFDTSQTRLGQLGGMAQPPPDAVEREENESSLAGALKRYLSIFSTSRGRAYQFLNQSFMLTGHDLYRLNCQSCHAPDGQGAPPEINSLIGPVEGISVAQIQKRMEAKGIPIGADLAGQLASQAEAAILNRLRDGGKKMPPFKHLQGEEVDALLGYLEMLADVPAGKRGGLLVRESTARVGEHLVKGTCHICHDATGPGGGHMAMMSGIIPSLQSFPAAYSLSSIEHQVEYGSSGMMMMMGNSMPPFPYVTRMEAAASYFYLAEYPPQR